MDFNADGAVQTTVEGEMDDIEDEEIALLIRQLESSLHEANDYFRDEITEQQRTIEEQRRKIQELEHRLEQVESQLTDE